MPYFWSNTIWFILLGIFTVIEMTIVLVKVKRRNFTFAFFLGICGMIFSIEAVIFCFLKSYNYFPKIFLQSLYDDGLAGNIFSQFSIASTALLIAVLNLKKYWIVVFAGIYGVIEELFLRLDVYSHNWYRTWMTVIGLTLIFWIVGKLYNKTHEGLDFVWRCIFIFFGLYTLILPTIKWIFKLSGILIINMKILPDGLSSYALVFLLNLLIYGTICMLIYFSKTKWWWKLLCLCPLYGLTYISILTNLIGVKKGWFFIYSTTDILGMYLCVTILDKLFGKTDRQEQSLNSGSISKTNLKTI